MRGAWFAIAFAIACALMQLIPAFQSPDENSHLLRADMIAHGQPVLVRETPDAKGSTGGKVDARFLVFTQWAQKLIGPLRDRNIKPSAFMNEADKHGWQDDEVFVHAAGTGYYSPLIYVPHAIGLKLSRELGMSLGHSYGLTRMLVTLVAFAITFWAWQMWRPSLPVLALLLMPMTLFQVISPTIDGLCFALALLVLSLFFHHWHAPNKVTPWQGFAFYLAIFTLVTCRTNLVPLLLLPLVLVARQRSGGLLVAACMLIVASAGWTLYGLVTTFDDRVTRAFSSAQIIGFYLRDPAEFLGLVGKTLAHPEEGYLILYSFIGYLGWTDALIPRYAMLTILCGLLLSAVLAVVVTRFQASETSLRAVLLFVGIASALLAFFALAVTWNPYPAQLIQGVHGRYLIIPAMFAAAALGCVKTGQQDRPARWTVAYALAYGVFCLFALVVTLQERYGMGIFGALG